MGHKIGTLRWMTQTAERPVFGMRLGLVGDRASRISERLCLRSSIGEEATMALASERGGTGSATADLPCIHIRRRRVRGWECPLRSARRVCWKAKRSFAGESCVELQQLLRWMMFHPFVQRHLRLLKSPEDYHKTIGLSTVNGKEKIVLLSQRTLMYGVMHVVPKIASLPPWCSLAVPPCLF